jgi:hypothetical protein
MSEMAMLRHLKAWMPLNQESLQSQAALKEAECHIEEFTKLYDPQPGRR